MNMENLKQAVSISEKTKKIFIATANAGGVPHIACAGKMQIEKDDLVSVSEWFCPGTISNLLINKNVSIIAWDKKENKGFQLIGQIEDIQDVAVMNGFAPAIEQKPLPQVERKLILKVEKILDFKFGPHSDLEI